MTASIINKMNEMFPVHKIYLTKVKFTNLSRRKKKGKMCYFNDLI